MYHRTCCKQNCKWRNDEKIQWHPAFDAALQIEFGDEAKYLEFDPEHLISKKPMQIDVLVKNEKHVKLRKNIGRIFRQYNIIEYKSPEDDLDIDDFYKTYAYACLYKSDTETVDLIPADELTITFVCYHYPRNMLRKLEQDRKFSVEQVIPPLGGMRRCRCVSIYTHVAHAKHTAGAVKPKI